MTSHAENLATYKGLLHHSMVLIGNLAYNVRTIYPFEGPKVVDSRLVIRS